MDWTTTLGETRARLLRLMRRGPRSVSELAEAVGISTNAVRTHVAALERDGFVHAAGVEPTGGKPARLYELTAEAEELFPKAYALVLTELLALFREETGEEGAESVLRRIGRRLAAGASVSSSSSGSSDGADRVRAAAGFLESIGGSVQVRAVDGGWVLSSAGCPFSEVVRGAPAVCALAESLVQEVTGRRVEEQCDRGNRPRCAFHVTGEAVEVGEVQ